MRSYEARNEEYFMLIRIIIGGAFVLRSQI